MDVETLAISMLAKTERQKKDFYNTKGTWDLLYVTFKWIKYRKHTEITPVNH